MTQQQNEGKRDQDHWRNLMLIIAIETSVLFLVLLLFEGPHSDLIGLTAVFMVLLSLVQIFIGVILHILYRPYGWGRTLILASLLLLLFGFGICTLSYSR